MTEPAAPLAPAAPEKTAVYNPEGRLVRIAAGDVPAALEQGYHAASTADVAEHVSAESKLKTLDYGELRKKGIDPVSAALAVTAPANLHPAFGAFQMGALEGATGGLGNVAAAKLGGALAPIIAPGVDGEKAVAQGFKDLKEAYPTISGAGEVAGMVGGAVLGGGLAGTLGKAGSVARYAIPTAAFDAAGEAAGGAALRGLGGRLGESVLGKAATTAIEYGARGAAEQGLYSGVHEMSEEMLGDHELNAEKIFAAASEGAALGGLMGGGLGAVGSVAKSGYRGLKGLIAETAANHVDDIEKLASEQRWKTVDPLKKYTREAEARVEGGTKTVGDAMKRYDIGKVGDDIETTAAKAEAAKSEIGKKIGDIHASSPATVEYGKLIDTIDNVIDPLRKKAGQEHIVDSLTKYRSSLAEKLGVNAEVDAFVRARNMGEPINLGAKELTQHEHQILNEAWAAARSKPLPVQDVIFQRKALDDLVYGEAKALDPNMRVGLLRDIRRGIEGHVVDAIDEAATKAGKTEMRAELMGLKRDYQAMSIVSDAAADSTSRAATNRNFSMSDYISGGAASHAGAVVGGAIAGGPGAMLGGLAGGALGAAGNKFARSQGNAIAAATLDKLAAFSRAQQAIRQADTQLAATAKALVNGVEHTKAPTPEPLRKRYAAARTEYDEMAQNPRAVAEKLAIPESHLPKTSAAAAMVATRAMTHLTSTSPPALGRPTLGRAVPSQPSDADMFRYVQAHRDTTRPLEALRNLQFRPAQSTAYTLQQVTPKMFADLQQRCLQHVVDREAAGKPLPFDARQRLHLILGIITDPSQDPKMVRALQQNLAGDEQAGQTGVDTGPSSAPRSVDLPTQPGAFDRLETR